ncbi:hypothetical protein B566_EDAN014756 [Ephemera danica]|nr:hypothetical protein B566_EDAN014756 [Ephemera danica]
MESGFNAVTLAVLVPLFLAVFIWIRSRSSFNKAVNKIPGPYAFPIIGNVLVYIQANPVELFQRLMTELAQPDEMWRVHRKVLTPAFHFNILHEFLPIFSKHALKLTQRLADEPESTSKQGFNIFPYSSLCSLDIICGNMNDLLTYRYFTPWLRPEILYQLSSTKRAIDANLKLINDFTDQVITERREYVKCIKRAEQGDSGEDVAFGRKRRMAFLDLLLTAEADGSQFMTQKDIRDQVSTFMFEGHDTVSTATCWVFFILGTYPDAQRRVVEELEEVFGDSGRAPDMADLANLKYLEPGCTVTFLTYLIHRDPEFWPDPEKFDPDRFLPENSQGRHPYSYVPFSAGPRNCIGQKFALLEEKVVVSTVLRRFRVEAAHSREEAKLQMGMVLRPKDGLRIRLFDRDDLPKLRVSS